MKTSSGITELVAEAYQTYLELLRQGLGQRDAEVLALYGIRDIYHKYYGAALELERKIRKAQTA